MSEIAVLRTQSQLPSRLSLIEQFSKKDQCNQQFSTHSINSRYASGDLDGYSIVLYQMSTKPEPHPKCTISRLRSLSKRKEIAVWLELFLQTCTILLLKQEIHCRIEQPVDKAFLIEPYECFYHCLCACFIHCKALQQPFHNVTAKQ
jgi:hypothetical protein